jgi:uncharacterized membrane protein YeiB
MELGLLGEAVRVEDALRAALVAVPAAILLSWRWRRAAKRGPVALKLED